jgi:hypothetical protein
MALMGPPVSLGQGSVVAEAPRDCTLERCTRIAILTIIAGAPIFINVLPRK